MGFTPNGAVDLEYDFVPVTGYVPVHRAATADATGKILINDTTFSTDLYGVVCTQAQASGRVTIIATDLATGNSAKDTVDAELWCSQNFNPPSSGDLSGCGF